MNNGRRFTVRAAVVGAVLLSVGLVAVAQTTSSKVVTDPLSKQAIEYKLRPAGEIDLDALIGDTQQSVSDPNKLSLVWWMPIEFWQASFAQDNTITAEYAAELSGILRPYLIVAVVDSKISPFGNPRYTPEPMIRRSLSIKTSAGKVLKPMKDVDVDPDVRSLLNTMKPVFAQLLGGLGQNMHFYVFENEAAGGRLHVTPSQSGSFKLNMVGARYEFKTPLHSVLVPKHCPHCKRELSGAYKFCPYDANKLSFDKPKAQPAGG